MQPAPFRFRSHAIRWSLGAAMVAVALVLLTGPQMLVPGIALVALTYYAHQLAAVFAGDEAVPNPGLALVVVVNALVVLVIQTVVFLEESGMN